MPGEAGYPRAADHTMLGSLKKLGDASICTSFGPISCVRVWVTNQGGFGDTMSGPRMTPFSMPSIRNVLWTQPSPLWMFSSVALLRISRSRL